jgi:hypothetical protein
MKLHRFWLLLIAALLALLASTSAQPPAEGAMGREVPPIVGMTGEPFVATATPHLEDSYNFAAGLQTVELRFADGTAVTIVGLVSRAVHACARGVRSPTAGPVGAAAHRREA